MCTTLLYSGVDYLSVYLFKTIQLGYISGFHGRL